MAKRSIQSAIHVVYAEAKASNQLANERLSKITDRQLKTLNKILMKLAYFSFSRKTHECKLCTPKPKKEHKRRC